MSTNADLCLKPLKWTNHIDAQPNAYREPTRGTRQALQAKLRHATTRVNTLQAELIAKEADRDAASARRDALIAERAEARTTSEDDITAVALGTASVADVAMKHARVAVVEAALPKVAQDLSNLQGVVRDANYLARESVWDVRYLEADIALLELKDALAPLSETLKRYFQKSGDKGLLLLPPSESPADTHD